MKGQTKASNLKGYIASLDEKRRPQIQQLNDLIVKTTKLQPEIRSGMLGYGNYHYRYYTGREGDWFCIGLASNASYISLYSCAYELDEYVPKLPKASIGKGCIRFKKIDDVDLKVIAQIVKRAAKSNGKTLTTTKPDGNNLKKQVVKKVGDQRGSVKKAVNKATSKIAAKRAKRATSAKKRAAPKT